MRLYFNSKLYMLQLQLFDHEWDTTRNVVWCWLTRWRGVEHGIQICFGREWGSGSQFRLSYSRRRKHKSGGFHWRGWYLQSPLRRTW